MFIISTIRVSSYGKLVETPLPKSSNPFSRIATRISSESDKIRHNLLGFGRILCGSNRIQLSESDRNYLNPMGSCQSGLTWIDDYKYLLGILSIILLYLGRHGKQFNSNTYDPTVNDDSIYQQFSSCINERSIYNAGFSN